MTTKVIPVNHTLAVEVRTGAHDPHVTIERAIGGLVRVEPHELRNLVAALVEAAGILAEGVCLTSPENVVKCTQSNNRNKRRPGSA